MAYRFKECENCICRNCLFDNKYVICWTCRNCKDIGFSYPIKNCCDK